MRKKYTTAKTLAAFIATASAMPIYSQAETQPLPSIELNFDVLENLTQPEPEIVAAPTNQRQPEESNQKKEQVETAQTPPAKPAIIIKKEPDVAELPAETTEVNLDEQPEKKKNIFSTFLGKLPFVSKKPETPAVSETVTTEASAPLDTFQTTEKLPEQKPSPAKKKQLPEKEKKHPHKVTKKPAQKEHKKTSDTPAKPPVKSEPKADDVTKDKEVTPAPQVTQPVAAAPIQVKPTEEVVTPTKKEQQKTESIIPTPEPKAEGANDSSWQQFLESSRKKASQAEPESVKPKEKEEPQASLVLKELPESLPKTPSPMVAIQPTKNETKKEELVNSKPAAPEKTTNVPEEKSKELSIRDEEPVDTTQAAISSNTDSVVVETKKATEPVVEKTARSIQTSELAAIPQKDTAQNKGMLSSFMGSLPSFKSKTPDASTSEPSAAPSSSLEEKMAESKKILSEKSQDIKKTTPNNIVTIDKNTEKKLGDTIDRSMSPATKETTPPVPDIVQTPMEIAKLTPPKNAEAITIKEIAKTPAKEEQKDPAQKQPDIKNSKVLISIAFDGNSAVISAADKEKLSNSIKQVLNTNQRLKVMSYAHGIDGEINSSRRISLQRAIAIRSYLIEAGLEKTRINVQAVGSNPGDQEFANSANIYIVE